MYKNYLSLIATPLFEEKKTLLQNLYSDLELILNDLPH